MPCVSLELLGSAQGCRDTSSLLLYSPQHPSPGCCQEAVLTPVSMWKQDEGSSLRVLFPAGKKVLAQEVFFTSAPVFDPLHISPACSMCCTRSLCQGGSPLFTFLPSDSLGRFCLLDAS